MAGAQIKLSVIRVAVMLPYLLSHALPLPLRQDVIKVGRAVLAIVWGTHAAAALDLLPVKHGGRLGVECKRMDATRLIASMRIALADLALDCLTVIYPGCRLRLVAAEGARHDVAIDRHAEGASLAHRDRTGSLSVLSFALFVVYTRYNHRSCLWAKAHRCGVKMVHRHNRILSKAGWQPALPHFQGRL